MADLIVPSRKVEVLAEADVVVCGGGPAGIAAACCAARHGAEVLLRERMPGVGGQLTNALVTIWHTSDRTKQVIWGFVQELIERSGRWGVRYDHYPPQPETHYFDPEGMRLVFQRTLDDYGVRTVCNLSAIESVVECGKIQAVLVDTKSGRKAVRGKIFIDATGDGDVAANIGLPYSFGRASDGKVQGMTMMFSLRGINRRLALANSDAKMDEIIQEMRALRDQGNFPPFNEGNTRLLLREVGEDHLPYNMCPASGNPIDEETLTRLTYLSRENIYRYLDHWRQAVPGYRNADIEQSASQLGVRESRRIHGRTTLTAEMVVNAIKQEDAIGHGFWMVDIHDPAGSGHTTWTDQNRRLMPPVGESYHIPLGICLNDHIANLAVVGRCVSTTHEAHASVRIQTHCMVMGQGVGTLAGMALHRNVDLAQVPLGELQTKLRHDGVFVEGLPAEKGSN